MAASTILKKHLDDEFFIPGYWWMEGRCGVNCTLNDVHEAFHRGKESQGLGKDRRKLDVCPIIWELLRRHPFIVALRSALIAELNERDACNIWEHGLLRNTFFSLNRQIEFFLVCFGQVPWCEGNVTILNPAWKKQLTGLSIEHRYLDPEWKIQFRRYVKRANGGLSVPAPQEKLCLNLTGDATKYAACYPEADGKAQDLDRFCADCPFDILLHKPGMLRQYRRLLKKYSGYGLVLLAKPARRGALVSITRKATGSSNSTLKESGIQAVDGECSPSCPFRVLAPDPGVRARYRELIREHSGFSFSLYAVHPTVGKRGECNESVPVEVLRSINGAQRRPLHRFRPEDLLVIFQFENSRHTLAERADEVYMRLHRRMQTLSMPFGVSSWPEADDGRQRLIDEVRVCLSTIGLPAISLPPDVMVFGKGTENTDAENR